MAANLSFDVLWDRYKESRKLGRDINPEGNRCALVLGAAMRMAYKPRKDHGELSFREISQPPKGIRGQPFLDRFYVKADELAHRLEEEWGAPAVWISGPSALAAIKGKTGVIFIEDAWFSWRALSKTVDHIDLWNGTRMGGYDEAASAEIFQKASMVWLWLVH